MTEVLYDKNLRHERVKRKKTEYRGAIGTLSNILDRAFCEDI